MKPQAPHSPDDGERAAWAPGGTLDSLLASSLCPPALPPGFRAGLRRMLVSEAERTLRERRAALEAEHAQRLRDLQAGYVRLRRDTLALALAVAFAAGAAATVVLPSVAATMEVRASVLAPLVAALIGLGVGAGVWFQRLGR